MKSVGDARHPFRIVYPLPVLIWVGVLMYVGKLGARRQITYRFKTEEFVKHLNFLGHAMCKTVAHGDTLAYSMKKVRPGDLAALRTKMVQRLVRMRCLEDLRFLEKYWLVAIDGTGYLSFKHRHCDQCLVKEIRPGVKTYAHQVLEAKLIFENGLSLSLETEFIDNRIGADKQDCELNAFYRLAERLKKTFPQLPICLSLDSLYANKPLMDWCARNNWHYIITFKEGSMPDVFRWYQTIKKFHPENHSTVRYDDGTIQHYAWVSPLVNAADDRVYHVLECEELKPNGEKKTFVWLTDLVLRDNNHQQIANTGGRLRWKIENQGFNMQKNGGYRLEHAYSMNLTGMMNFYLLLQIAHIISQLMEKGSLLKKQLAQTLGCLRNIAHQLLEDLRTRSFNPSCLSIRIQIRLDSS